MDTLNTVQSCTTVQSTQAYGTLFSSVVPLRPHTPGPGLCRSVFSRPVCPYAIVTFDPVTRDLTILPGAVPAGAALPAHSLGEGTTAVGRGSPEHT